MNSRYEEHVSFYALALKSRPGSLREMKHSVKAKFQKWRCQHAVAALGFPTLSLISVCSSTGVLLSDGTEKDPAGFCL